MIKIPPTSVIALVDLGILCFSGGMGRGSSDIGLSYHAAVEMAEAAELSGFDSVLLPDEMYVSPAPASECWITLTALALRFRRVKLGPYVTCNSYRHPAILAKMAATFDHVSGGRLEFFLGACGWGQEVVHSGYGIDYPPLNERVERLKEAIKVIRALWSQDKTTFQGKYYSLKNALCEPKPLQKPLEIWTGGSSDVLIKAAAEVADGWDTAFCTLEGFLEMSRKLDIACEEIGRNPKELKRSMHWHTTLIGRNRDEVEEKKRIYIPSILDAKSKHPTRWIRELPNEEYIRRRFLIGTPEECLETISAFTDSGCSKLNFVFPDAEKIEPIKLFGEKVADRVK